MLKMSSDIDHKSHNVREVEILSSSVQQNGIAVNRLRRHLSRTITQPRGLYEAILDTYGPINVPDTRPDVLQKEASEVDEAYRILQASCSSDTETCSSHEDGQELHFDHANDRKDSSEIGEASDHAGQKSRSRRSRRNESRSEPQKRTDEDWAKSILSRRTGYGCLQRNQVVKYISQLETSLSRLEAEISNLSPKVSLLDRRRWVLQGENDYLKQKIATLSRYQLYKEGQSSELQKELQLLRIQQVEFLQHDAVPSCQERLQAGDSSDLDEKVDVAGVQARSHDQRKLPSTQTTTEEPKSLSNDPSQPSLELQANSSSLRRSSWPYKEPQEDGKVPKQLSLVKWPSSLYRSVSSIRKDVLEIAIEEST